MKKKIIVLVLLSVAILIAIVIYFVSLHMMRGSFLSEVLFNHRIDHEQIESVFIDDFDLLEVVAYYMASSKHESISNSPQDGEGFLFMFTNELGRQYIAIEDENVVTAISALRERGYGVIIRNNNVISFLRWPTMNRGRGILYSIDRSHPDELIFVFFITLEPLSKSGWFYYEHD